MKNPFEMPSKEKNYSLPEEKLGGYEVSDESIQEINSAKKDSLDNNELGNYEIKKPSLIEREDVDNIKKSMEIRETPEYKKSISDLEEKLKCDPEGLDNTSMPYFAAHNLEDFKQTILNQLKSESVIEFGQPNLNELSQNLNTVYTQYEQLHEERTNEWLNYQKSGDIALDSELEVKYKSAVENYGKILNNLREAISFINVQL